MFHLLSEALLSFQKVKKTFWFVFAFASGALLASFYQNKGVDKYAEISGYPRLEYESFLVQYDSRNKVPLWTHEHLTKANLNKSVSRNQMYFSVDNSIYPYHRSSLEDYKKTGFDRGHMVPAADQQHSSQALKETFFLTNICPQNASLNRGAWAELERKTRSYVSESQEIDVITGPLYLPKIQGNKKFVQYEVIGKNNVAVPSHFFKVIVTNSETISYIIPNQNIDSKTNLEDYRVSIETVEKFSGLEIKTAQRIIGRS